MSGDTNSDFMREAKLSLVANCNAVLQMHQVTQANFDRSVEYQNDPDIILAIEQLALDEPAKDLNLSKIVLLQIVDFYNKLYKSMIEAADPKTFDSQVFTAQLEDKIFAEFSVELNDMVHHFLFSEDGEIKAKMNDLRQSFSSIQKLNQSTFE